MRTRTRPARARLRLARGVAMVAAATIVASPGVASAGDLPINQEVQEQDQWCWAASGLTIAKFHHKGNVSQNEFCNMARGFPQGSSCPNEGGLLQYDQQAFRELGLSEGTVTPPIPFQSVQSEIDSQRPIQTGIYWTAGGGHSQVIYGYGGDTVAVGDPWPSSPRYSEMPYDSYVSNGEFQWAEALWRIGA